MVSLNQFIERQHRARRPSRRRVALRHIREDVGDVSVTRSPGFDTATVALPGGVDLEDRTNRMNEFWKALVEFQYRDVMVVALCVGED